ncbi:isochorismatase family cysteine hydrolase [Streptomyces sp. NPDC059688]|uniref:isochorismatase family cysteine hydrolase n=1 Tax=Streptomyces sp. NPDC059688 TaxID=3346906 RepID=UPI0036936B44
MTDRYDTGRTAVLLVDPYNDFLSEGGKLWSRLAPVADEVGLLCNLRTVVDAARTAGLLVAFVPHRRYEEGDYVGWDHPNPTQRKARRLRLFARDSWGGEFHPDFQPRPGDLRIAEHWAQSGFANTDLDCRLKQHGVTHVILIGLLANTCVESTGRFAMELGYHVTLVTDATAAFSADMLRAAHELNGPTYAHAIVTTAELVHTLSG